MNGRYGRNRCTIAGMSLLAAATVGCGAPLAHVDATLLPPPPHDAITFWGHACSYIDVGGYGIVTDPVFEKQLIIRRRKVAVPPPTSYQNTRLVLISHAHNDHLSPETLATFPDSTWILCPEPAGPYLSELRQHVKIMHPGDTFDIPGGRVTAVTANHTGGRWAIVPYADGRALGYVIETRIRTIYYSGDSEYFDGFATVGREYRPDVALLNINGSHLSWKEAVLAAHDLQVSTVIPMHFGAFGYLFIGEQKRPRGYAKAEHEMGDLLHLLEVGESLPLRSIQARALP